MASFEETPPTESTSTEEEVSGIAQMRSQLTDAGVTSPKVDDGFHLDEVTLRRYFRARKGDASKAVAMLQETIAWRKSFDLQGLYDGKWADTIQKENATGKMYTRGCGRNGHMLLYMKPRFENTNNHDGNLKHVVYNLERAARAMTALGAGAEKCVMLIDYEGYR